MDFVSIGLIAVCFIMFFGFIKFCESVIKEQGSDK